MLEHQIVLPSKPRAVKEDGVKGVYEIDGLYKGYGHTLGNSLRRIILSSLPGYAITTIKIDGVSHEFSTIEGVKEDVITILLNLKRVRFQIAGDEETFTISLKGPGPVTAGEVKLPGGVTVLNPDQHIAEITGKQALDIEITVEKGLGFVSKEALKKGKVSIGTIVLDANFTPIRRVNYEVEDMRVGDRTDYNRLRVTIETDGSITAREALERSVIIMIKQLQSVVGVQDEVIEEAPVLETKAPEKKEKQDPELMKTRIESLAISPRLANALIAGNIRTLGGLTRKREEDLLDIDGLGSKGIQEIKKALMDMGLSLKD